MIGSVYMRRRIKLAATVVVIVNHRLARNLVLLCQPKCQDGVKWNFKRQARASSKNVRISGKLRYLVFVLDSVPRVLSEYSKSSVLRGVCNLLTVPPNSLEHR